MDRRNFVKLCLLTAAALGVAPSQAIKAATSGKGNFTTVYSDPELREDFFEFLQNVFRLYPEHDFHELITKVSTQHASDKAIYLNVQEQLEEITPILSAIRYQLPALWKQKEVMAKQTLSLLGEDSLFNGYLEIGSSGRYLDYLEEKVNIEGKRYYADGKAPGYSIQEMIDRGQIPVGADYIPFTDYSTNYASHIEEESLDLVTVYIGFHHCPIPLRKTYIQSIARVMRKGGKLVLRDHDCHNRKQETLVALAHDVFNLGTSESWDYNQREVRNFYTLPFIIDFVSQLGFRYERQSLYQAGDPTRNALMLFTKIA